MYTKDKINIELEQYNQCKSVTTAIRILGYPTRRTLYEWIKNQDKPKRERKKLAYHNTKSHPRNPSVDVKIEAINRCFEDGESIKSVSEDIGYSRAIIYTWRKNYLQKGMVGLMNRKNIKPENLKEGSIASSTEVEELKSRMFEMQLEIDILKETINVLKKDPGIDMTTLKNWEKAVIIDALKIKYSLPILLEKLDLARSCYYYQQDALNKPYKYTQLHNRITELFYENKGRYGYRRIYGLLTKEDYTVSEKIIRRVMKLENLTVKIRKKRKYNSYKGEISPAVSNVIDRDFHANKPNQKWLTDITEFAIPSGKVYLSPVVDCFDGQIPSWTISTSPDSELVNSMLENAISQLNDGDYPIVHSDRGCHYRWPGWIERMNKAGLIRSMSKKGCTPDNSACEGFFGLLKNEFFYNQDWSDVSIEKFIDTLDAYLVWYNEKRIKISLGYMSPMEYRHSLGLSA